MSPSVLNIKMDGNPEGFVYYNLGNVNDAAFD